MMARWLLPDERTAIFACSLPSSLSKSAALFSSGSARTPDEIAGASHKPDRRGDVDDELAARPGRHRPRDWRMWPSARRRPARYRSRPARNAPRRYRARRRKCAPGHRHSSGLEVDGALLQGANPASGDVARSFEVAMSSRWKSRSSFTSGLLERSTEAQPLKAPSPIVPVSAVDHHDRAVEPRLRPWPTAGLDNRSGASTVSSTGMFCRCHRRRRHRRLDRRI